MKKVILTALLFYSTSVLATGTINGSIHHNTFGGGGGSAALDVVNKNNNVNKNLNGNKNTNTLIGGSPGGLKVPHQAPSFGIGTMFPTAPCQGTKGGGFSVPWGGAALSGSHTLRECEIRETIRTTIHMNGAGINTGDIARELLCKTQEARDTSFCSPYRAAEQAKRKEAAAAVPKREAKLEDLFNWLD